VTHPETRPASVRIGVTGHRSFDDVPAVRATVAELVAGWLDRHGPPLDVWSSLAEGADRLVAEAVLAADPSSRLMVVLPLAPDDFRDDFATSESLAEFDGLLARAATVEVTGPDETGTRESAYARAGLAMLDAVDVLVAVWDGAEPRGLGGTGEVVAAARTAGREVVVIPVTRPPAAS